MSNWTNHIGVAITNQNLANITFTQLLFNFENHLAQSIDASNHIYGLTNHLGKGIENHNGDYLYANQTASAAVISPIQFHTTGSFNPCFIGCT